MKIAARTIVAGVRDVLAGSSSPSNTLLTIASPLQTKVKKASGTNSATIHLIKSCRVSCTGRSTRELINVATLHYLTSDNVCLPNQAILICIKPFQVSVDREDQRAEK